MTRLLARSAVFGAVLLTMSCAHQKAAEVTEPVTGPKAAPVAAQVEVTPRPDADEGAMAALESALRSATIYFAFDQDRLSPEGMSTLQRVGEVLHKHPTLKIRVEGNCDERGTEEYNLLLGQRRAEVAKSYLLALGAQGQQVDTVSYGAERPVDPRHAEDAWAKNRRADMLRRSN